MDPRADRQIDEDLKKGAVESAPEGWGEPHADEPEWHTGAVALTEDIISANTSDIKQAEEELGADDDGTPG